MAPAVTIRKAVPGDVAELTALAVETYDVEAFLSGGAFTPADLSAYLEANLSERCFARALKDDTFLLAFVADRMVGFVQLGPVRLPVDATSDDRELRRLYVHADVRGHGMGTRLMDAAFAEMRSHGVADVYLDVWERNDGAKRLYERHGFQVIGAQRMVLPSGAEGDHDLIMVRRRVPT